MSPQCGCAANDTCDVSNLSTGAVSCVLAGSGALGTHCTATSECARGLTCRSNACRPFCSSPGAACTDAGLGVCYAPQDGSGKTTPNLDVCAVACDLRSPAAACGTNTCLWLSAYKETDCGPAGSTAVFKPCTRTSHCRAGLACVNHPTYGYECEKWCRLGGNDCAVAESCNDVFGSGAPSIGGQRFGTCQ